MISIIMPAYNRAHTLPRAIDSVLRQDYPEWELIIVDDGSTDNTAEVLARYQDPRIRVVRHDSNRGVNVAKNKGFDAMRGEWFTFVDSDDEIVPAALSTLIKVPKEIDSRIDHVICNCLDVVTGKFTCTGLDSDQHVESEIKRCVGGVRGITKTSLLGGLRFNEKLVGFESVLWLKLDERATHYYIHQALYIYHTEGSDRICNANPVRPDPRKYITYKVLLDEEWAYLNKLRSIRPDLFSGIMFNASLEFVNVHDVKYARKTYQKLRAVGATGKSLIVFLGILFGPSCLDGMRWFYRKLGKPYSI